MKAKTKELYQLFGDYNKRKDDKFKSLYIRLKKTPIQSKTKKSSKNDSQEFLNLVTARTVTDYSEKIEKDINNTIKRLAKWKEREPTIEEFKTEFLRDLLHPADKEPVTLIMIRHDYLPFIDNDTLIKQVNKIIRKKPTTRVRVDEIKRYLKVYDLKKRKLSNRDIVKILHPDKHNNPKSNDPHDILRAVKADYAKAKNIVKNLQEGKFPVY